MPVLADEAFRYDRGCWTLGGIAAGIIDGVIGGHFIYSIFVLSADLYFCQIVDRHREPMPNVSAGSRPIAFVDWTKTYMIVERKAVTLQVDPYSVGFCVAKRRRAWAARQFARMRPGSCGSNNVINSRHTCEVYLTIRHVITQSGPHRCRGSVVIPVELRSRARTGSRVALARRGFVALCFRPHVALEAAAEPIPRAAASISLSTIRNHSIAPMRRATPVSVSKRTE